MLKHSCKTFSLIGKIGKVILSSSMYKAASLNWLKQTLEWKCLNTQICIEYIVVAL